MTKRRKKIAFTVGNPLTYEPSLDEGEVEKCVGGIVFRTHKEAEAVLEDGHLPLAWGYGKIPGRVYGLKLPGEFKDVTKPGPKDYRGGRWLLEPATIVRV